MFSAVLATLLMAPPAGGAAEAPAEAPAAEAVAPAPRADAGNGAKLRVGPGYEGSYTVEDTAGNVLARLRLRKHEVVDLQLPATSVVLKDAAGKTVQEQTLASGGLARWSDPGAAGLQEPPVLRDPFVQPAGPPVDPVTTTTSDNPYREPRRKDWRRWGAPLLSALVPGVGQMVNREYGRGVGFMLGTYGSGATALGLIAAAPRPGENRSFGIEATRLGGFGLVSGFTQLLYAAQIMDAYRVAANKTPTPRTQHRLRLDITRTATVGLAAADQSVAYYSQWSLDLLGQPTKRLSVGVTDLGFNAGTDNDVRRSTIQGGARIEYRFYDRKRVWLGAGVGAMLQGTRSGPASVPLDSDSDEPLSDQTQFTAVPYGQLDVRWFMLDRWSLNVMPRFSMPVGPRYFGGGRSIASLTPTLEVASGVGWYF